MAFKSIMDTIRAHLDSISIITIELNVSKEQDELRLDLPKVPKGLCTDYDRMSRLQHIDFKNAYQALALAQ